MIFSPSWCGTRIDFGGCQSWYTRKKTKTIDKAPKNRTGFATAMSIRSQVSHPCDYIRRVMLGLRQKHNSEIDAQTAIAQGLSPQLKFHVCKSSVIPQPRGQHNCTAETHPQLGSGSRCSRLAVGVYVFMCIKYGLCLDVVASCGLLASTSFMFSRYCAFATPPVHPTLSRASNSETPATDIIARNLLFLDCTWGHHCQ